MKYVLVVNEYGRYYTPFAPFGEFLDDEMVLEKPDHGVVLAVFTGGEDVSPKLYGEPQLPATYSSWDRDAEEYDIFKKIRKAEIPMVGICRGAQFLCVMAGGKLVQHVDNHAGSHHAMLTHDGRKLDVNSLHHQMQYPPASAKVLGWAETRLSNRYLGVSTPPEKENEVVYYPNINALGIQYHPEMMSGHSEGWKYCVEMTQKLLQREL